TMSTGNKALMGRYTDGLPLRIASILSATIIIILNLFLVYLTLTGQD
ncbi:MAG: divalent metal cation transporter, partial [Actinomyces graevenitzii]|nr:divalent metal cation transporter [Actinomyces graevenitzii]